MQTETNKLDLFIYYCLILNKNLIAKQTLLQT